MKQTVILIALLTTLTQSVRAIEINDSYTVQVEDVPALKVENYNNARLAPVEGDRFIVSLTKMNWFAAYGFCNQQNATLLSLELGRDDIKKQTFTDFINLYHLQSRGYWLFGNRLEDDKTFRWGLGGLPLSSTDWDPGEPNNAEGQERCMKLFPTMRWDDHDCFSQQYAACQKY